MNTPEKYQTVMPYLVINDADKFLDFAKGVFNAKEIYRQNRDDQTIKHAEIQIGGSTIMVGHSNDQWKQQPAGLFVFVEEADTTYQKALDHGAESLMEPSDQEYGRSCGVKDPFGNTWWITSVQDLGDYSKGNLV